MVRIGTAAICLDGGALEVSAQVEVDWPDEKVSDRLWFRLPGTVNVSAEAATDACFVLGLLLAMASGQRLQMDGPVSARLLADSAELQGILTCWHPRRLKTVALDVNPRSGPTAAPGATQGTISFFSGGADSFYTALAQPDRVGTLVFVHGFDIPLSNTTFFAEALSHVEASAASLGKPLVTMSTNLRRFTNQRAYWGPVTHGVALAAAGLLLHSRGDTLLIPASYTYTDLHPWGTHPLTDRLRSTEYLQLVHDGADASRAEKILHLAHDPVAQRHLRVCWQKTGAYNCGLCEKCLRTMVTLKLAGTLHLFETFPDTFTLDRVREMRLTRELFARDNYRLAKQVGDAEVAAAVKESIARYRQRVAAQQPTKKPAATKSPVITTTGRLGRFVPAGLRRALRAR